MRRYANLALGALLVLVIVTGLLAQAIGTEWARVPVVAHGVAAFGVVALTPWKSLVVGRGMRQRNPGRMWSIGLAATTAITIVTGLIQMSGTISKLGPLTTMQLHVGGGVATGVLAVVHFVRHPVRPSRLDVSRRNSLRTAALGLGSAVMWFGWEGVARAAGWPGAKRRFTGSHERGSGDPSAMPATQWFTDSAPAIGPTWEITIDGSVIRAQDVDTLPLEVVTATLDCTSGWYSTQEWRGVRLDRVLDIGDAASIEVRSATGYTRRFPAGDASKLWLAFEIGGAPLTRRLGFPARLVVPGRRGFWWVKWVESITTSDRSWWLQPPFPLQ
ncbi:MAG: molybdopterin-dependent oxidoreductase [Acidimicrobiia bacterium]|nr:molybdopterin-dependent oxidoreductase [Acidimicrobiia bacterium]